MDDSIFISKQVCFKTKVVRKVRQSGKLSKSGKVRKNNKTRKVKIKNKRKRMKKLRKRVKGGYYMPAHFIDGDTPSEEEVSESENEITEEERQNYALKSAIDDAQINIANRKESNNNIDNGVKNLNKSIQVNVSANIETIKNAKNLLKQMRELKQCPTDSTKSNLP